MLKYLGQPTITFAEFPDEISLVLNISNCPGTCKQCSEPELREDVGELLTFSALDEMIRSHPGITLIGIMGGDNDHSAVEKLAQYVHEKHHLRVGMYSGFNFLDINLLNCLDYYKIGEFRPFVGDESTWKDQTAGPIVLPVSNQVMFKRVGDKWINITDKFRKHKINNWKNTIL